MGNAAPYENPLIPNARLRQMLLAMLRARHLEQVLPRSRRAGVRGLEACLVAPAIDLGPADLISDAFSNPTVQFLRGASLQSVQGPTPSRRGRKLFADSGAAAVLPFQSSEAERLWAAVGAAAALSALASVLQTATPEGRRSVLVAYLRAGEAKPAELRRLFAFTASHQLRMVFVALPSAGKTPRSSFAALAQGCGIPAIAVDCHDAVAIYRVAQESIGRARSGGGPAFIDCVPYQVRGGTSRARQTTDPLAAIQRYILERAIATPLWIARETRAFVQHLSSPVH